MTDTPALEQDAIVRRLRAWNEKAIAEVIEFRGETTIVVPQEHLRRACEFLRSDPQLAFNFLSDLSCRDCFPAEPRFEVNYHLLSIPHKRRLRLKVRVNSADPVVESVTTVWPTANWHEREVFDLFGVRFEGHTDLRRIVLPEDWEGYPLRKDYPTEGYR